MSENPYDSPEVEAPELPAKPSRRVWWLQYHVPVGLIMAIMIGLPLAAMLLFFLLLPLLDLLFRG